MKNAILTLAAACMACAASAQISLETTYSGAMQKLYMVSLEVSGPKYIVKSDQGGNRFLKFYNLNHSLWKTVNTNAMPTATYASPSPTPGSMITNTIYTYDALYITEKLFDCDDSLEFLYCNYSSNFWYTGIYNESGRRLLKGDSMAPLCKLNIENQYKPIYNTPNGTKLILSHLNGSARVYALTCSLSPVTDLDAMNGPPVNAGSLEAYPNPGFHETTIRYTLPEGVTVAEIVITDLSGRRVAAYKVDDTFSQLLLPRNEIPAGTYIYSLSSGGHTYESKKIILMN